MFIRSVAVFLALIAIAGAQAPDAVPPKPRVITLPKKTTSTPKSKPKPKPKPKANPAPAPEERSALPPPDAAAEPEAPKRRSAGDSALGAYMPKVKAALGKSWAATLQPRAAEFQPGNVSVTFKLDADGKVTTIATTQNSSNAAFGKFCEDFVRGIQFEPPPARALEEGTLEIPFTFWLY